MHPAHIPSWIVFLLGALPPTLVLLLTLAPGKGVHWGTTGLARAGGARMGNDSWGELNATIELFKELQGRLDALPGMVASLSEQAVNKAIEEKLRPLNTSTIPAGGELAERGPMFWALVQEYLRPFQRAGITKEDIGKALGAYTKRGGGQLKVLIYNNEIYVESRNDHQARAVLGVLHDVTCSHKLPNLELVVNSFDIPIAFKYNFPEPLPVFSWSASHAAWDVPIPYHYSWGQLPDTPSEGPAVFDGDAWMKRSEVAFWRGSTTGCANPGEGPTIDPVDPFCQNTAKTFNITHRARLIQKCNKRPDLCDAQFTGIVQGTDEGVALIEKTFGKHNPMDISDQVQKYKYVMLVDGNGPPSSRAMEQLRLGTVLLWQETEGYELFYRALRPYVHYIPLAQSLDDLYSSIEWARRHPEVCKLIAQEAQAFAGRYLNKQFLMLYMHTLLSEYAKLLRFDPVPTPEYTRVPWECS